MASMATAWLHWDWQYKSQLINYSTNTLKQTNKTHIQCVTLEISAHIQAGNDIKT